MSRSGARSRLPRQGRAGQGPASLPRILLPRLSSPLPGPLQRGRSRGRPGGERWAGERRAGERCAGPVHGCQQEGGSEDHHHRSSGRGQDLPAAPVRAQDVLRGLPHHAGRQHPHQGPGRGQHPAEAAGSDGCMLAFDVTDRESFEALDNWRDDFLDKVIPREQDFPMVVLGNKIDLSDRQVPKETASAWCKEKDIPYFEVSAKNDINVAEAFETLAKQALSTYKGIFESYLTDSIKLTPNDKPKQPKQSCC
ncbi:PREDICTED: ras-related protein Rab-7b isoform X2 [Ficedula albicollis]|uniref:ras-related protein Rab-7b isoform X2 n=1 Tax=Ficedula albicollis TaxID=59894 RepID=UPI000359BB15|nr:PREDICTED: ras-related protein Rab-7b isoform X2 [Ficedula albicollis]